MKQAPCSPANSVLEGDLQLAVKHQIIKSLTVVEVPAGFSVVIEFSGKPDTLKQHRQAGLPDWFHILVQLLATPGKQWYLTTRRNRTSPRIFNTSRPIRWPTCQYNMVNATLAVCATCTRADSQPGREVRLIGHQSV